MKTAHPSPVSESSTACLHKLAILTGLNELQTAYKLQSTLAFLYLPFVFRSSLQDFMSECAVGKVLTRHDVTSP